MNAVTLRVLIGIAFALATTLTSVTAMANEEPAYEVLRTDGPNELRQYRGFIVAETVVQGDMDAASSQGFRRIASYIFGANRSSRADSSTPSERIAMTAPVTVAPVDGPSEKIAMTAPVTVQPQDPKQDASLQSVSQWRVHFVMPAQYTMATLPKPLDASVNLREVPGQRYAVRRFSNFAGVQKVQGETDALLQWLKAQGMRAEGPTQLSRYDAPWTLPFMRRNEVMIQVSAQP